MKYAKLMMAMTLTLVPMLAVAQLKSSDRIVTQVPFEFAVGNKVVPAGECILQATTADMKTVTVRNTEARASLFSTIMVDEAKAPAANYALVFNKYGERYFLSGVKIEGDRTMYRLPVSKAEAELRAANVPASEKILLASLQ